MIDWDCWIFCVVLSYKYILYGTLYLALCSWNGRTQVSVNIIINGMRCGTGLFTRHSCSIKQHHALDCASCPPVCVPSPYLVSHHSTAQCILHGSSTLHSNHSIHHLGYKDMLILHSTAQCILGSNCSLHIHHSIHHLGYKDKLQGRK